LQKSPVSTGNQGVFPGKKSKKSIAFFPTKKYTWCDSGAKWSKNEVKSIKVEEVNGVGSVTGTYEHSIDPKGRLFIPAKLREELGSTCYLTLGLDACLAIYPEESWKVFTEKFASLPMTQSRAMRPLFAKAAKCEPDSQGRILIPQFLRQYAKLDKDVVIIGVHNRAEIWDAATWRAQEEEMTPEKLAALMESLEF
jgi:MraZ protein